MQAKYTNCPKYDQLGLLIGYFLYLTCKRYGRKV